jgi:hypothetical protein
MTREEARQLARQLRLRFPQGAVTRVFGGVEVETRDRFGWVFMRTADDSPLLALLTADSDYTDPA